MAAFIPVSAKLRESFLRPVSFGAPLPVRTDAEQAISQLDLKSYTHTAAAPCTNDQWLAFRQLVAHSDGDNAVLLPRSRELNLDKVSFRSFSIAAKYVGLKPNELHHLNGPAIVQNCVCYLVGGAISRDDNNVAPPGVLLNYSWAGGRRLTPLNMQDYCVPEKEEEQTENESEVCENASISMPDDNNDDGEGLSIGESIVCERDEDKSEKAEIRTIEVSERKIVKKGKWADDLFTIDGINLFVPNIEYQVCIAVFNRVNANGEGRVKFQFPVTCFGPSHNHQKVHDIVSGE